jgi:hypothetical protein
MAERITGAVVDFVLEFNRRELAAMKGQAVYYGTWDDVAGQEGLLFSPALFRRYFLPAYRKLIDNVHAHGLFFGWHCCGAVHEVLPLMIDAGIDVFDVVQTSARDSELETAPAYGQDVCFRTVDVQKDCGEEPQDIQAVRKVKDCGLRGGIILPDPLRPCPIRQWRTCWAIRRIDEVLSMADLYNVAAGIDVGGPRKGFHAVLLRDGRYFEKLISTAAAAIAAWVLQAARARSGWMHRHWRRGGHMRPAERDLARKRIHCFATPRRERGESHPFAVSKPLRRLSAVRRLLSGRRQGLLRDLSAGHRLHAGRKTAFGQEQAGGPARASRRVGHRCGRTGFDRFHRRGPVRRDGPPLPAGGLPKARGPGRGHPAR